MIHGSFCCSDSKATINKLEIVDSSPNNKNNKIELFLVKPFVTLIVLTKPNKTKFL